MSAPPQSAAARLDDFAARPLADVLPDDLARRTLAPLSKLDIACADDLYECIANLGGNWFRSAQGIDQDDAARLADWLADTAARWVKSPCASTRRAAFRPN